MNKVFNYIPSEISGKNNCSIVSNSSILLDNKFGDDIDKNDLVVRMNSAPIKGYESYVGSKKGVRVLNGVLQRGQSHSYSKTPTKWISTLSNEKILLKPDTENTSETAKALISKNNSILEVSDEFKLYLDDVRDYLGVKLISTGLFSILVFIHVVDSVELFGFDFYDNESKFCHYWEDYTKSDVNLSSHSFDKEKKFIINHLTTKFRIMLY